MRKDELASFIPYIKEKLEKGKGKGGMMMID